MAVDFLRRHVRIDRQLVTPSSGPPVFGPPKTPASNRVVPLPAAVGDALAAHLARFPIGGEGLIFTTTTGRPVRRNVWSDAFGSAAEAVGVKASPHDLRHHAASLLISSGCSIKAVQHFLGHATAAETLDTYAHLWPEDEDRIRAAIDGALGAVEDSLRTGTV